MAAGEIYWNAAGTKFYQLSSCEAVIREYDYNRNIGKKFKLFLGCQIDCFRNIANICADSLADSRGTKMA